MNKRKKIYQMLLLLFAFVVVFLLGGLIGGFLSSKAVGVKYKSKNSDIINGIIMTVIFVGFLIYMIFFK